MKPVINTDIKKQTYTHTHKNGRVSHVEYDLWNLTFREGNLFIQHDSINAPIRKIPALKILDAIKNNKEIGLYHNDKPKYEIVVKKLIEYSWKYGAVYLTKDYENNVNGLDYYVGKLTEDYIRATKKRNLRWNRYNEQIKIEKNNRKINLSNGVRTCGRCGGSGVYMHYGVCYGCGGSGTKV
jgi:hypothetical protein